MLRVLLLFAILLTGALAVHEKAGAGTDPNGLPSAAPAPDLRGGLDPDGLQTSVPTPDVIGGLDPNG